MTAIDQLFVLTEEERQQQGPNVRAVDVSICHDHNLVIAQLVEILFFLILTDTDAQSSDESPNFLVAEHLVHAGLLNVENLTAQGENGLMFRVSALFGRAACRVTLNNEYFGFLGLLGLAVGELAGQGVVGECAFTTNQVTRFAGRFTCPGRINDLLNDEARFLGVLLEKHVQFFVDDTGNEPRRFGVTQLGFGLSLELRIAQFDRNDRGQAFTDIITGQFLDQLLGQIGVLDVVVDGTGQGGLVTGQVGTTFDGADVVRKRVGVFLVGRRVLQCELDDHVFGLTFAVDDLADGVQVLVDIIDVLSDTTLKFEHFGFSIRVALVLELDGKTGVEVGQLLETLLEHFIIELIDLEDFFIRAETLAGTGRIGRTDLFQFVDHVATLEFHPIGDTVSFDRCFHEFGQGVDA